MNHLRPRVGRQARVMRDLPSVVRRDIALVIGDQVGTLRHQPRVPSYGELQLLLDAVDPRAAQVLGARGPMRRDLPVDEVLGQRPEEGGAARCRHPAAEVVGPNGDISVRSGFRDEGGVAEQALRAISIELQERGRWWYSPTFALTVTSGEMAAPGPSGTWARAA